MFRFTKEDKKCLMKIGIGFIVIMILIKLFRNTTSSKIVEGLGDDDNALATAARSECQKQLAEDDLDDACRQFGLDLAVEQVRQGHDKGGGGGKQPTSDTWSDPGPVPEEDIKSSQAPSPSGPPYIPDDTGAADVNKKQGPLPGPVVSEWEDFTNTSVEKKEEILRGEGEVWGYKSSNFSSGHCSGGSVDVCKGDICSADILGMTPPIGPDGKQHDGAHCPFMNPDLHPFTQIKSALKYCNNMGTDCGGITAYLPGGDHGAKPQICFRKIMDLKEGSDNPSEGRVCMKKKKKKTDPCLEHEYAVKNYGTCCSPRFLPLPRKSVCKKAKAVVKQQQQQQQEEAEE